VCQLLHKQQKTIIMLQLKISKMDHDVIRILKSVKAAVSKNGIIAISAYRKKTANTTILS